MLGPGIVCDVIDLCVMKVDRDQKTPGKGKENLKATANAAGGKKGSQIAKSVGTSKAKRDAALAKKRGMSKSAKPEPKQVEAEVQRTTKKVGSRHVHFE